MGQGTELPLGAVMVDVAGCSLTEHERARLRHPGVGGVILFSRNYASTAQLRALCADIRSLRSPALLIAVDHEGGRVQRFRTGFTAIPPMRTLGELHEHSPEAARQLARACGIVLAHELIEQGVDFSFAPVLDLDFGRSAVIGNRAFHHDPQVVGALAAALLGGLRTAGMAGVGKHFPGHGFAQADSHHEVPVDDRPLAQLRAKDLEAWPAAIAAGMEGVMPAHVIYPALDPAPAGFSARWLGDELRTRLGFRGLIFSDDLAMEGASVAGDIHARAEAAFAAGCDMVLVCNAPARADELLARLQPRCMDVRRAETLRAGAAAPGSVDAHGRTTQYLEARRTLARLA
jgi:beta-N-acetylhexosaminidase